MKKLLMTAMLPLAFSTASWAQTDEALDHKVVICHKETTTLALDPDRAQAYIDRYGDTRGRCPGDTPRPRALVLMRCDNTDDGAIVVDSLSVAHGFDVVNPLDDMPEGYNCARALRRLLNADFRIRNTHSGGGGSGLRVEYLLVR